LVLGLGMRAGGSLPRFLEAPFGVWGDPPGEDVDGPRSTDASMTAGPRDRFETAFSLGEREASRGLLEGDFGGRGEAGGDLGALGGLLAPMDSCRMCLPGVLPAGELGMLRLFLRGDGSGLSKPPSRDWISPESL
jgi:hypothetical protein